MVSLQVRKSGRRARRASKAVLLELMRRRKRGRPPIITDPQACKFCGKVFIVLKDYKAHLVSFIKEFGVYRVSLVLLGQGWVWLTYIAEFHFSTWYPSKPNLVMVCMHWWSPVDSLLSYHPLVLDSHVSEFSS